MIKEVSNSKFISIHPERNIIKMISKFNKQYIENEIIMLNYLSKLGLPTPIIIDYNKMNGEMTQQYYTNTTLFKLYSSPLPIKFSPTVLDKIQSITNILRDQRIFIDDFQFIYNNEDVILIDPSGVYHLLTESKCFIFSCIQTPTQSFKKKRSEVENGFIYQMKRLQNILEKK